MTFLRHRASTAALLAVILGAGLLLAPGTAQAAPRRAGAPILFGLYDHTDADRMVTERELGKRSALVGKFFDWNNGLPALSYLDKNVTRRGAALVVATGPAGYAPLSRVISGGEDVRTGQWAEAIKAYGHPVMIRLMAEMNGSWEPWSTGQNGNKPGEYVLAWRHIVDVFRAHGATNAIFVWNPNRAYRGATSMRSLYPGSAYVDWIGLDVYNFNEAAKKGWLSFDSMMKPSVRQLRQAAGYAKPMMLNEVGTAEGRGKPLWIKTMFASLPRYGVRAVNYFDELRHEDWRLTKTAANRAASRYAVHHNNIKGAGDLPLATIERIARTGA